MAMEEIKIEPMTYIGPGFCPECLRPLIIVDSEQVVMDLDKHGNAINIIHTSVNCRALCPRCGNKYKMMRSGGVYKPYSEASLYFDQIDREAELEKRLKGLEKIENPFAL